MKWIEVVSGIVAIMSITCSVTTNYATLILINRIGRCVGRVNKSGLEWKDFRQKTCAIKL